MRVRYVTYCIRLVVIIAVTVIIATRWRVWFGNGVEVEYSTSAVPARILLTMGNDADSRTITWQCDTALQEAYVEYYKIEHDSAKVDTCRVMATGEKYASEGGCSVFYRATVDVLSPGEYAYRVCHPTVSSYWNRFHTNDVTDSSFNFIFIGDIQDTLNGVTDSIITDIAHRHDGVDFYLLGGDFIHRPHDLYWGEGFRGISAIATTFPVMAVSGNHEHRKGLLSKSEMRFPLHFAYFLPEYHANDYCFYTIKYDNADIYLLDSHCDILRLYKQRRTLENALKESTAQWKIVVLHHPPYSIRNKWNNLHLRWMFAPIFSKYNVHLVLSGHEHGYARIEPDRDGYTPIYTISHCSTKTYEHSHSTIAEQYGNESRYYQLISVDNDTMTMECYTTSGDIYDTVKIVQMNGKGVVE